MGCEYFALSYGSCHQKMVLGQKKIKEDKVKGKLRREGVMVRVVCGIGRHMIGNNENLGHRFRNRNHLAVHLERRL